MKEIDRSHDKDTEEFYSVNFKNYKVNGDTVKVPDELGEAIKNSWPKYEKRPASSGILSPEELAAIAEQVASHIDNPPVDPDPEYKTPTVYPHEHWLMGPVYLQPAAQGSDCNLTENANNVTTYSVDVEPGETITINVTSANSKRVGLFKGSTAEVMENTATAQGVFLEYVATGSLESPNYILTYKNTSASTQAYFFYMTNNNPPEGFAFEVSSDVIANKVAYPTINVAFEYMGFDANGEVNDNYNTASDASTTFQTKRRSVGRYKVKGGTSLRVTIPSEVSAINLYEYSDKNVFFQKTSLTTNTWLRTSDTTSYIAFEYVFSSDQKAISPSMDVEWYGEEPCFCKKPKFNGIKRFVYAVTGGRTRSTSSSTSITNKNVYSTGLLQLPKNYSDNGKPVKLIIFCHSSGDYHTWNTASFSQIYADYIQYLVDEGYAVYDSFGRSSDMAIKYSDNQHVFGTVDNMNCLVDGYRWVVDNYNIDKDGCYSMGKSLGGLQALNLCWSAVPVKACAGLAPALDPLARGGGYTNAERAESAEVLEYSGDTTCLSSTISLTSGYTLPDMSEDSAYRTLMEANKNKWIGYLPMWNGLTDSDIDDLLEWTYADMESGATEVTDKGTTPDIMKGDQNASNWANLHRTCRSAIKIWSAPDDTDVPCSIEQNFIKTLTNGNCIAELRAMPSGTGGHHAVDYDTNALKQSGVTKIGVTYTDIPTAYVEAVEFFRRFD